MRLGVHIVSFTSAEGPTSIAPTLARVARIVDDVGLSSVSVMDHYFQMDQMAPAEDPMLEGYTTLGFLAAQTTTVRLGLLVSGVTYRHPGLLAKIVATLDVLSGGRAELGIGAAWYEREHRGLGVPFPPVAERFERLEEALQICLQMWDPENVGTVRRSPLPARRDPLLAGADQPATTPDPDRRAAENERRSGSLPSTATPATCSRRRRPTSATSSTCCAVTATTSAVTTTPFARASCTAAARMTSMRSSTRWPSTRTARHRRRDRGAAW